MEMKIVGVTLAAFVSLVVLAAVLVPILDDATTVNETFTNEGYYRMSEITSDTDVTISWDHTKPTSFFIDDVEYPISVEVGRLVSIVGTDGMLIRYVASGDGSANRVQVYSAAGYIQAAVSAGTDLTVELTNDSISATVGETTKTMSITQGYYIDPNGSWSMKKSDDNAYLHKSDSVMIFAGVTNIGVDVGLYGTGTIEDGMDINYVQTSSSTATVTFGDVTFDYTDVSGYVDLASLSKCTFDITVAGTPDTTGTATYSYFIVPYEVSAERAQHLSGNQIELLDVIPVLVIVAILLAVIALVVRSKLE